MRRILVLCALLLISACATSARAPEPPEARGRAIAQAQCASCHAVGLSDSSPAPEAPALRLLSRSYRVDMLEEALAEGISVGHPAMPNFAFAPDDVDALITYLQAIQTEQRQ